MIRLLRSYRLFPILLIGLTSLLTVWLDQISRWDNKHRELNPYKPEYVAEQLLVKRFDIQGNLKEQLIASHMWQYPGKDNTHFRAPQLSEYQQGVLQYQLEGEVGRYNHKTQQAYFDRKVTLTQPATADSPETRVITSAMYMDTANKVASSSASTLFYHGLSHGNSLGFIYQQQTGKLNLLSTTRIVYAK